jgi:hypothetical protein
MTEEKEDTGKLDPSHKVPTKPAFRERLAALKYLKEFKPNPDKVRALFPHPTGWILGIAIPVITCVAILHAVLLPDPASANGKKPAATEDEAAQKSAFRFCLSEARTKTAGECDTIKGRAEGARRFACTLGYNTAGYTKCVGQAAGRFGRCLSRCGQNARICSTTCAAAGGTDQTWTHTARCLMPCWRSQLDTCVAACF